MPVFEYICGNGHLSRELVGMTQGSGEVDPHCPECGRIRQKTVSMPARNSFVPPHMTDEGYLVRARNRAEFLDTPETKARLASGELEYDTRKEIDYSQLSQDPDPQPLTAAEEQELARLEHQFAQEKAKLIDPVTDEWKVPVKTETIEVPDE